MLTKLVVVALSVVVAVGLNGGRFVFSSRTISVSALIVVGTGRVGRVLNREVGKRVVLFTIIGLPVEITSSAMNKQSKALITHALQ